MKKILLAGASVLVLSYMTPAFSDDTDKVVNATGNMFIDTINKRGIFQWVEGQFSYKNSQLQYGVMGFTVLSENKNRLNYLQTSLHRKGSANALNLGIGMRNLTQFAGNTALVGVNLFIDTKDGENKFWRLSNNQVFRRLSLGLELKTGIFDFSANYYDPVGNATIRNQKTLKGYDITAKGHIPNLESLSVGLSTYRFSGTTDTIDQGNKLIAEFKPNSILTLRAEYDKPKSEKAKTEFYTGLKWAFNTSPEDQLKPLNIGGDAWAKRYDKVERQYEIRTEDVDNKILSFDEVVVGFASGAANQTVTAATVLTKLKVTGGTTKASEWAIKSFAKKDALIGDDTLEVSGDKKSLIVKKTITSGTIVIATLEHPNLGDMTAEFTLKTSTGSSSSINAPTGLKETWGKGTGNTLDYKLIKSVTIGDVTNTFDDSDFTFEVLAPTVTQAGFTSTTQNIGIDSGDYSKILDTATGQIYATGASGTNAKRGTSKKGTLLIKVTRKSVTKDGIIFPAIEGFVNVAIEARGTSDSAISNFTPANPTGTYRWQSGAITVTYPTAKPANTGAVTYALADDTASAATTAGTLAGGKGSITVAQADGKISGTVRSGTVRVKMIYAASDHYEQFEKIVEVPIARQSALSAATITSKYTGTWTGSRVTAPNLYTITIPNVGGASAYAGPTFTLNTSKGTNGRTRLTAGTITSTGDISATNREGVLHVKATFAQNIRYEKKDISFDVTFARQPAQDMSTHTVAYTAAAWGTTFTPTVATMPQVGGTDAYTPTYTRTASTNGGSTSVGGTVASATGVVTGTASSGTIRVTVAYPQNDRYLAGTSKTVTLTVNRKPQTAEAAQTAYKTWSKTATPQLPARNANAVSVRSSLKNVGGNFANVTVRIEDNGNGITDGAVYSSDYLFYTSASKTAALTTKAQAKTLIDRGDDVFIGTPASSGANFAVKFTFTFNSTADGRYSAGTSPVVIYYRTR